jgi:hypothetical protein
MNFHIGKMPHGRHMVTMSSPAEMVCDFHSNFSEDHIHNDFLPSQDLNIYYITIFPLVL